MKVTLKKTEDRSGYALVAYQVLGDGVEIGHVEQVESSKTGFRYGRCVGQVLCRVWKAYRAGRHIEHPKDWASGFERGFWTRAEAVEALLKA